MFNNLIIGNMVTIRIDFIFITGILKSNWLHILTVSRSKFFVFSHHCYAYLFQRLMLSHTCYINQARDIAHMQMQQSSSQQHHVLLLKLHKIMKAMMSHAYQVPAWRILSLPLDTYKSCLLFISLQSYSTEVL